VTAVTKEACAQQRSEVEQETLGATPKKKKKMEKN
jgi:hypothetical protein